MYSDVLLCLNRIICLHVTTFNTSGINNTAPTPPILLGLPNPVQVMCRPLNQMRMCDIHVSNSVSNLIYILLSQNFVNRLNRLIMLQIFSELVNIYVTVNWPRCIAVDLITWNQSVSRVQDPGNTDSGPQ